MGLGQALYAPSVAYNVISLHEINKLYKVTFADNAFHAELRDLPGSGEGLVFTHDSASGLYLCSLPLQADNFQPCAMVTEHFNAEQKESGRFAQASRFFKSSI